MYLLAPIPLIPSRSITLSMSVMSFFEVLCLAATGLWFSVGAAVVFSFYRALLGNV